MPNISITAATVNKLPLLAKGQALYRDTKLQGFGLRVGATVKTYFVEKRVEGRNVRFSLGIHGQITPDKARELAGVKLGEMTGGADLSAEKKARVQARQVEKVRETAATEHTVMKLCDWYVKHQTGLKKESAKDAAGIFAKYVEGTEFAAMPAREFTAKQATAVIRTVVEAGHRRTAAKLRAYLRAAYALAQGAETNADAPAALLSFNVDTNPIASTAAIKNSTGTRDVTLTEEELGETVRLLRERRALQHDDGLAALELSLLLGGQRVAQTLRITAADVDLTARTITLFDPKGRRETARRHVLPLTPAAVELLKQIEKVRRADWLFGDKAAPTTPDTVARKAVALLAKAQANIAARNKGRGPKRPKIEARDLRRTAETQMASMGISKDVRAQLLSHGLGGVQSHSYDRHEYMTEKRNALEAWAKHLQTLVERKPQATNVKRLRHA
jgi:integrase